ncbi:sigma-70 family RNA polymerase sigma factor [Bacillus sp. JJ722]|uniref:sigma-70 family RNA polymerase sigma factor n=1 Tax=Bacillus sp. JJ722 TaxID=3122973 RepID=UPI0030003152
MNLVEKENINKLVDLFLEDKSEWNFEKMYKATLQQFKSRLMRWGTTTSMAGLHDIFELFDEMLLNTLDDVEKDGGDFVKLLQVKLTNRYKSLLRKISRRKQLEVYEAKTDDEAGTSQFEIASDFNLEATIIAKKKADQLALIDSLLNGADSTTKRIVEAFLSHPKPTATAIAKELGYHHSKVTRALNRLGAKFNTKQYGDYHDYLVAL